MFIDDHNPPHLHIYYGDYVAVLTLDKKIIKGEMPASVVKKVSHWVDLHKAELLENWKQLMFGKDAEKVQPLK
jgi:hypothetical protein